MSSKCVKCNGILHPLVEAENIKLIQELLKPLPAYCLFPICALTPSHIVSAYLPAASTPLCQSSHSGLCERCVRSLQSHYISWQLFGSTQTLGIQSEGSCIATSRKFVLVKSSAIMWFRLNLILIMYLSCVKSRRSGGRAGRCLFMLTCSLGLLFLPEWGRQRSFHSLKGI